MHHLGILILNEIWQFVNWGLFMKGQPEEPDKRRLLSKKLSESICLGAVCEITTDIDAFSLRCGTGMVWRRPGEHRFSKKFSVSLCEITTDIDAFSLFGNNISSHVKFIF